MDKLTIIDTCTLINAWIVKDPYEKFWMVRFPNYYFFVPYNDIEKTIPEKYTIDEVRNEFKTFNSECMNELDIDNLDGTTIATYATISGKARIPEIINVEEKRYELIKNRNETEVKTKKRNKKEIKTKRRETWNFNR